jgi:hypothetical protein
VFSYSNRSLFLQPNRAGSGSLWTSPQGNGFSDLFFKETTERTLHQPNRATTPLPQGWGSGPPSPPDMPSINGVAFIGLAYLRLYRSPCFEIFLDDESPPLPPSAAAQKAQRPPSANLVRDTVTAIGSSGRAATPLRPGSGGYALRPDTRDGLARQPSVCVPRGGQAYRHQISEKSYKTNRPFLHLKRAGTEIMKASPPGKRTYRPLKGRQGLDPLHCQPSRATLPPPHGWGSGLFLRLTRHRRPPPKPAEKPT